MRRLKELIVGTRYERLNTQEHVTSSRGDYYPDNNCHATGAGSKARWEVSQHTVTGRYAGGLFVYIDVRQRLIVLKIPGRFVTKPHFSLGRPTAARQVGNSSVF